MPEQSISCTRRAFLRTILVLGTGATKLGTNCSRAAEGGRGTAFLVASPEPGWPQWRGPRRDGMSDEVGLLSAWPEGGPKLIWKSGGLGRGYCAPIISRSRIYLAGEIGDELHVLALDLDGQKLWQSANGRAWDGPYPGARASCAYSDGALYHLNAHGRLACLDAGTGLERWAVDILERFGGKNLTWAASENLLVDGPRVFVTPGGTRALMAALDKGTGATLWTTEPLRLGTSPSPAQERLAEPANAIDQCSYGSSILFTLAGRRHLVNSSLRHVFGVDADTGQLLWTRPLATRYSVIAATPVLITDAVFVTAPDTEDGGKLFRLIPRDSAVEVQTVWTTPLDTCHGGWVYVNDSLFGSWYRRGKGWACIDAATGAVRYRTNEIEQGSILYADRRLYCLSQTGDMCLIKPTATRFEFTGRFRLVPERQSDVWTHPVILDGRLYLRYHETLFCYDVRRQ